MDEPQQDTGKASLSGTTVALIVLTVLAVLYTLYFARSFLLPIAFAVLLNFLLSPAVRLLGRMRIPNFLGAAIVVLGLIGERGREVRSFLEHDLGPGGLARSVVVVTAMTMNGAQTH